MTKRPFPTVETTVQKIVGGGQSLGEMPDGRKLFIWGALPGEAVKVQITKKKSHFCEGTVTEVLQPSPSRTAPRDPQTYLSTSPWQIMNFADEQHYKAALIEEAFELHDVVLPQPITVSTDNVEYAYRNKIEFSWYSENDASTGVDTLDLAFFRRGSKGKVIVNQLSLARPEIMNLAIEIRDLLRTKPVTARNLKTLLIRCNADGSAVWQLYLKDDMPDLISAEEAATLHAQGGEVIYSDPRSPASRITKRLRVYGDVVLRDTIRGVAFSYATEGFFQVNLPVYEMALADMQEWVADGERNVEDRRWKMEGGKTTSVESQAKRVVVGGAAPKNVSTEEKTFLGADRLTGPASSDLRADFATAKSNDGSGHGKGSGATKTSVVDMYSGVGSIGLTIGGDDCTLVEIDENAVREMRRNIAELGSSANAVLAPSEKALDYITGDKTIIVDPPRAGLHADVVARLLETKPHRIVYLSCNPVTQARDVALLCADETYGIRAHQGYNFFPRTPHIENLVVLDKK